MNRELLFIGLTIFLGLMSIILAFVAIHHKKLSVAVISTSFISLFASIVFLLLAAPDVAMTEAAIGSGLTTLIFFYVLNKIKKTNA